MKQSSYKGKSPLPDFVIDAACGGEEISNRYSTLARTL